MTHPAHNQGKKYLPCPFCHRKRYCIDWPIDTNYKGRICSQLHEWKVKISTFEQVNNITMNNILPTIKSLFDRDDSFYAHVKKSR